MKHLSFYWIFFKKEEVQSLYCLLVWFFKWAEPGLFLVYFCSFSQRKDKYCTNFTLNDKSIDGLLGSRTQGSMMEGADESTELWWHHNLYGLLCKLSKMVNDFRSVKSLQNKPHFVAIFVSVPTALTTNFEK